MSERKQTDHPSEHTVLRDDATVMRRDPSVSISATPQPSWSSQESAATGGADTPKVLKQRFVLEEKVGSGGMGTVFRAKDLRKVEARDNQPHVAIKVLNNDFRQHPEAFVALEREASKSQGLRHNNIVSIFDFDKDGDLPFITMELLEGNELAHLLRDYPTGLPQEDVWGVIQGMVEGLAHAHAEGVVHADFKPGNIFITNQQTVKILDFGIARAMRLNQDGEDTIFDPTRLAALTPAYASREMLNGDNAEARDDLYSLGVVIYMALSGHHPFGRLPATDAAAEGLKPERIKSLSRRQWHTLERCLRFNRQERPESTAAVFEGMFGKPAWQSWGLAAAVGMVAIGLLVVSLVNTAEIDEVREEVRQQTLVDAQIARLTRLLHEVQAGDQQGDAFNEQRQRLLRSELQTLRTLAPDDATHEEIAVAVAQALTVYVDQAPNLEQAVTRLAIAGEFGSPAQASQHLESRLYDAMDALFDRSLDEQWLIDAQQYFAWSQWLNPRSSELAALRLEIVEMVRRELPEMARSTQASFTLKTWRAFDDEIFDEAERSISNDIVEQVIADVAVRKTKAEAVVTRHQLHAQLDQFLQVSCLRLDVDDIVARVEELAQGDPAQIRSLQQRAGTRINECVTRLSALDPDRAWSFSQRARQRLGRAARVAELDPCALNYLVGNGAAPGRGGYCEDKVSDQAKGPRLVVVPGHGGKKGGKKFAVSKYEISWQDFSQYCADTGLCDVPDIDSQLPVTGVHIERVEAYARWLSRVTGYRYRLPNEAEWRQLATGEPDPNRNCRVEIAGVRHGEAVVAAKNGTANPYGIVHVLGNVQELVRHPDGYVAAGGSFGDPIEMCMAAYQRPVEAQGDEVTGFRLIRELS